MYKAVVVGFSAGGAKILRSILGALPAHYPLPILVVGHQSEHQPVHLTRIFEKCTKLVVERAEDKMTIAPGHVYVSPSGYHMLLEEPDRIALSVDGPVNYVMPSIDVLFESAADATNGQLIGLILSGASSDGANGLRCIKEYGGVTVVQDPEEAPISTLPRAAVGACEVDYVVKIDEMISVLMCLCE